MDWSSRISHIGASLGRLPEGTRIYTIGDIHGRLDLLNEVLARVAADMDLYPVPNSICVFLGDYIDRGPDSKRVLDRLINYSMAQSIIAWPSRPSALWEITRPFCANS